MGTGTDVAGPVRARLLAALGPLAKRLCGGGEPDRTEAGDHHTAHDTGQRKGDGHPVGRPEEARRTKAAVQIQSIEQALKLYKLDNGQYPTTEQGLTALVEPPAVGALAKKWRTGGYLEKGKVPKDPWDNDFVYISPGVHGDFDLISFGPDGQAGGEDKDADINNWELQ